MKKRLISIIVIALFIFSGCSPQSEKKPIEESDLTDKIQVTEPQPDTLIRSPLVVRGRARGTWFFEASFPVYLSDEQGNNMAIGIAEAKEDWMTGQFVPFEAVLEFTKRTDQTRGTLILERDDPSGIQQRPEQLKIPVQLK